MRVLHLAVAEVAALAEQGVDQRRLAVVDVGDDGNVSNIVSHRIHCRSVQGWIAGYQWVKPEFAESYLPTTGDGRPREGRYDTRPLIKIQRRPATKVCANLRQIGMEAGVIAYTGAEDDAG